MVFWIKINFFFTRQPYFASLLNFFDGGDDAEVTFNGDAFIGQGGEDEGISTGVNNLGIVTFNGNVTINGQVGAGTKVLNEINFEEKKDS